MSSDPGTVALDIVAGVLTGGVSLIGNMLGWFASGTDYAPGGMAVVGEQGPELVNLPAGSKVTPNSELSGSIGQGATVNIYSPRAVDPSEAAAIMRQSMRELAFSGAM